MHSPSLQEEIQADILKGTAAQWSSTAHLQRKWDWRAAANWIGGGTGVGLLLSATAFSPSTQAYRLQAGLALAIIALGLLCIMAKLGRPTRAFNIFRARTSWMTREGLAMPTLFGCGALSIWRTDLSALAVVATLSGLFFLYSQARILREAKGIPAWAAPGIVPLILLTGLAEGVGLAAFTGAFLSSAASLALAGVLLASLVLRHLAWLSYRKALDRIGAPPESLAALGAFAPKFEIAGQWVPGGALVVGLALGGTALTLLSAAAGLLAMGAGWALKYTLVTRAGYFQRKSFSLSAMMARVPGRT